MKISPGQRIQWRDWRNGQWHNATVVAVEKFVKNNYNSRYEKLLMDEYPFIPDSYYGTGERYRIAIHVDFFADDPKYIWPFIKNGCKISEINRDGN